MNYKYKISGEEYIFSQEEHDKIQNIISSGKRTLIRLRNDTIGLDTSLIRTFKPTQELTQPQEEIKSNTPLFPEPNSKDFFHSEKFLDMKKGLYEKMGWNN